MQLIIGKAVTIITILICSLLLLGCGYSQLPKSEDTPEISRNNFRIEPTTYPVEILLDSSYIFDDYFIVDSKYSVDGMFIPRDVSPALDLLIKHANEIDADVITNIHYRVIGDSIQPPPPPLPDGQMYFDYGEPPPKRRAEGTFIKKMNTIPVFKNNDVIIFSLRCCPYYNISLRDFNGKEFIRVQRFTKSEFVIDPKRFPAGMYSITFNAFEPLGIEGIPNYWYAMRYFEIIN